MPTMRTIAVCLTVVVASAGGSIGKERPKSAITGAVTDPGTGVTFPKQVGSFTRQGPIKYDDEGYPTASYATESLLFASVFYYKGEPFGVEYANARDAVKRGSWNAKLAFDRPSNLRPSGRWSVFTFVQKERGGYVPFLSELLMFPHRGYFLKFRITFPAETERAQQEIDAFVRSFPLP